METGKSDLIQDLTNSQTGIFAIVDLEPTTLFDSVCEEASPTAREDLDQIIRQLSYDPDIDPFDRGIRLKALTPEEADNLQRDLITKYSPFAGSVSCVFLALRNSHFYSQLADLDDPDSRANRVKTHLKNADIIKEAIFISGFDSALNNKFAIDLLTSYIHGLINHLSNQFLDQEVSSRQIEAFLTIISDRADSLEIDIRTLDITKILQILLEFDFLS